MAMDLSAKSGKALLESDAGSYIAWSGSDQPIIAEKKLGAGKLVLKPQGMAMPHYGDSSPKFGLILEGTGIAGIIAAGDVKEKLIHLQKGDVIIVPMGCLSWWYNNGSDQDLSIIYLGDTTMAVQPGDISYFFLSGPNSILNGLSMEFLTRAWGIDEKQAQVLFKSQPDMLLTKLEPNALQGIKTRESDRKGIVVNINHVKSEVEVKNAGHVITLTSASLPMLKEASFFISMTKLEPKAMMSPGFWPDAAVQEIYVVKGSGHVQIVGTNGMNVVNEEVKEGSLFVVPGLFVLSVVAGDEGIEWISLVKTTKHNLHHSLTGKTSFFNMLTPQVLQAALGANSELINDLKAKGNAHSVLIPPPKAN
ncbi:hypothetical protein LUZ60_011979 [Juncus effusus]|nr:hypothetical protein LUZ60_011979 [Juncus effusus]